MSPLVEKVATAVLGASLIGGGTAVLNNWHTNGVQDAKIETLVERQEKTDQLIDKLNETNANIAVLNERLKWIEREQKHD